MTLNNETALAAVLQRFPDAVLHHAEPHGMLTLETTRDHIIPMLTFVKEDPFLKVNFLTSLCGMHHPEQPSRELGVVYHLHSFLNNYRFRIKVYFPESDPVMPTATALWPTANWMERETFDFFGVVFTGHPNLKRILNVEDLDAFPLRKEFKLEDGTRTDKDDRFFGRQGHTGRSFD